MVFNNYETCFIYFPFIIGWSITLLVFSFLITRNVLKNDASAEFQHYSKVQELEEIFKLSDFKEGLITIGFFEPEEILSLDSAFDLNDFIREIQNLSPEKQDIIIKNLTKIIDTPLKSHQTPIIFNH